MNTRAVCGVIVTYHPSSAMLRNMQDIRAQVQDLIIVDNGSSAEELTAVREASHTLRFELVENGENLGIAAALNQGVCLAKSKGYSWVILFDQDSRITSGFIEQMFRSWELHPQRERVGTIQPRYVDAASGIEFVVRRARDGGPITSMTSGALMPMWIFDKIGLFAAEYFIDMVDYEYSLRIRASGYLIAGSQEAVLLHSAGDPKRTSLLGFSFSPTHHSATRRYYMSRNRVVVYKKYFSKLPSCVFQSIYYDFLRETIKCFIAEKDRLRKFRNFVLGTWDGLIGRMGKREGV